jgi:hypothetical protein
VAVVTAVVVAVVAVVEGEGRWQKEEKITDEEGEEESRNYPWPLCSPRPSLQSTIGGGEPESY